MGCHCVVWDSDHDAVTGPNTVKCRPYSCIGEGGEIKPIYFSFSMFLSHFTKDFKPSLSSQSPLLTMQLMPPGYTFLMNSQSRGLKGGFAASSCSMLEIQMQIGFSAGLSWKVRQHPDEFHREAKFVEYFLRACFRMLTLIL